MTKYRIVRHSRLSYSIEQEVTYKGGKTEWETFDGDYWTKWGAKRELAEIIRESTPGKVVYEVEV